MAYTELYVRADAAGLGTASGANDTTNATTGALSWAEMLAYGGSVSLAGIRFNIKAGTYTRSAATDTFTVTAGAATTASPCALRGFNSAIGDLDTVVRTAGQALTVTNHPVIAFDTSGSLVFPSFCEISNLNFTSSINGATFGGGSSNSFYNCRFYNSHATGSSVRGYEDGSADRSQMVECDFEIASSSSSANALYITAGDVRYCLIIGGGNGGNGVIFAGTGSIGRCMIRDAATGITSPSGDTHANIDSVSFRNITTQAINNPSTNIVSIMNCVAWLAGGSSKFYNSTTSVRGHMQVGNAVGNSGAADTNEGDYQVRGEVTLTSDPFTSSTDLTLNNTAGGGADCRAAGIWPYQDIGALQHQDAGGGGGPLIGSRLLRS